MNRPKPGDKHVIPAARTGYRANGAAPLGYHVGPDGMLWLDAVEVTIVLVRATKRGFRCTTDNSACPVVVL